MKSFFGGKTCTREACAIRSLKPEAPLPAPSKAPALQKKPPSSSAPSKGAQSKKVAPTAQKRRSNPYDFSALDDDSAGPSGPSTRTPTAVGILSCHFVIADNPSRCTSSGN